MGETDSHQHEQITGNSDDLPQWELRHVLEQRQWLMTILLTRTGGRWEVAEDLWSGMVAEVVERPSILSQVQRLQPWLYRLACNKTADWVRGQKRAAKTFPECANGLATSDHVISGELPPLELLLEGERQSDLRQMMGQLQAEDQEVLYLKYAHGWNYSQIGQHLGLTQHQVTNRLRAARQRLKLALLRSPLADDYSAVFQFGTEGKIND